MCKALAIATVIALVAPSVPAFSQAVEIAPGGPDEALLSQGRSVAQPDSAANCRKLASTRTRWAIKAKAIVSVFAMRAPEFDSTSARSSMA